MLIGRVELFFISVLNKLFATRDGARANEMFAGATSLIHDNRFAGETCNVLFMTIGLLAKPAIYCL